MRDTFHRLDGSELAVEVRAVAFLDHGRPSTHLVIRDITARLAAESAVRQVEARLQQAQRMELIGALSGIVAHEVNNMMQVVMGFGDSLLGGGQLPQACFPDVEEIIRAATRAGTVTQELLAFSRRAAHRPRVVDLRVAVQAAESAIRRLLTDGQRLVVVADTALEAWVDPGQLQQVVLNLAINARDAMPADGTLTMTVAARESPEGSEAAEGATIPAGLYATVIVQDTGMGMDAPTRARIFEPFFTTKPVGRGSGLGLAAAQGIMRQNGGYITVSSTPGQGATFVLYLPLVPSIGPG